MKSLFLESVGLSLIVKGVRPSFNFNRREAFRFNRQEAFQFRWNKTVEWQNGPLRVKFCESSAQTF